MADSGFKYVGTKNGISTIFNDAELAGADAGSIGSALNYDNTAYTGSVGSGFGLGSLTGSQLGGYAQLGGLTLGTVDDMFLTGSKVKKEKLKGLKQNNELIGLNIDATKQAMADRKQFNKEAATGMNAAMRNKGLGTIGLSNGVKV